MRTQVASLTLHPLAIPLRRPFAHAASVRKTADPIVVAVELANGTIGYGETVPRPYVTGETVESVADSIENTLLPALADLRPANFPSALEACSALATHSADGKGLSAARAGVELALLDAYSRCFGRPIVEAAGWSGLPRFGPPGSLKHVRYSGVIGVGRVNRIRRNVRLMRCYGLRDFKLKVGTDDDDARVRAAVRALSPGLKRGVLTLRLDANGAWDLATAIERLEAWEDLGITCVEQPLAKGDEANLPELHRCTTVELMHDESLVTHADAESLVADQVADWFNLRLSKNGGFLEAIRIAGLGRHHHVRCQLGCMVGETSILSAAGRRFLECVPEVEFAEGSYGQFLLADDVIKRPVRFGYGGRAKPLEGPGWGIEVDPTRLSALAACPPIHLPL